MIKDDQGGTRNPYKCMNVLKQDAMDDKIIERCKICENQCMQEGLDRLGSCQAVIERKPRNIDGSRICRESNRQTESSENFLNGLRRLDKKNICRRCVEELSSLKKRGFSRWEKHIEMNA